MSNGLELLAPSEWMWSVLGGDATLGALLGAPGEIYEDTIPPQVQYPYVIYQHQGNADTQVVQGITVLNRSTFIVKGVDRAESYDALAPLYSRVHTLLHQASGMVVDGQIYFCARTSGIRYPQITEAVSYRHLGGVYRFWVQGT